MNERVKPENLAMQGTWKGVRDRCRATVSKGHIDSEVSENFKRKILLAEHNPIRFIKISWEWHGIKSWIATHFARHVMLEKYISTQRDDRTGVDRDSARQDAPVIMMCDGNLQSMIDMMRKRLCGAAHKETQGYAEDLKEAISGFEPEIAEVLVPNCVYRCGCPEMHCCGKWQSFSSWVDSVYQIDVRVLDIPNRYKLYNEYFATCRKAQHDNNG